MVAKLKQNRTGPAHFNSLQSSCLQCSQSVSPAIAGEGGEGSAELSEQWIIIIIIGNMKSRLRLRDNEGVERLA